MKYTWDEKFDLALFDGGAGGAGGAGGTGGDGGAGADMGAGQEDATPVNPNRRQRRENPLAKVKYGIQPTNAEDPAQANAAPGTEEQPNLDEEWKTVKERFKDQIGREKEALVKDRLKNSKQAEAQMQKLAPILTALGEKYGKGADDIDGIVAAYTDDDSLYRQMADQYTQLGRQAMRDATGTAAGLTGGYGNSYANLVGNQANQAYLTQLNNNIPELYDRALKAWLNEGADLESRYDYALAHTQAMEKLQPQKTSGTSASKTASKTSSDGGFWDNVLSQIKSAFPNTTTTPAQQTDYYQALYNERKKK